MLIAVFLFLQLQNVVPVTVSMKGFLSKTFKKSMRVEIPQVVSTISSIATSLLSVQSLLSPLPFDRLDEDGTVDWVRVCMNNQLLYQESLSCYRRMRRKKYNYEYIPSKSRESTWYREYVLNTSGNPNREGIQESGSREKIQIPDFPILYSNRP